MAFEELSGKDGSVVIARGRNGSVLRPRITPKNPKTAAQVNVRANLTKASQTFKGFNSTQLSNWNNYAGTLTRKDPVTGQTYHPTAISVFVEYTTKFLQANAGGTIPLTPPTTAFTGDDVLVTVSAGPGKVTFTANKANAANVTTELLLQPLASPNVKPQSKQYRSKAFFQFVSGTLTKDVAVPAGYWAAGYRFVNKNTGQETEIIPLTVNLVGYAVEEGGFRHKKAA